MLIGGVFCRYIVSGWIYIFLLSSLLGFIWIPLWIIFIYDTPEYHKTMHENERNFLYQFSGNNMPGKQRRVISLSSLPWSDIFLSKPIIALFITQLCNLCVFFFFSTTFGKLLQDIHHISMLYIGYIVGFGFILMQLTGLASGMIKRTSFFRLIFFLK